MLPRRSRETPSPGREATAQISKRARSRIMPWTCNRGSPPPGAKRRPPERATPPRAVRRQPSHHRGGLQAVRLHGDIGVGVLRKTASHGSGLVLSDMQPDAHPVRRRALLTASCCFSALVKRAVWSIRCHIVTCTWTFSRKRINLNTLGTHRQALATVSSADNIDFGKFSYSDIAIPRLH